MSDSIFRQQELETQYLKKVRIPVLSNRTALFNKVSEQDHAGRNKIRDGIDSSREGFLATLRALPNQGKLLELLEDDAQGALTRGELERFDALVGNGSCESVASIVVDHYDEYKRLAFTNPDFKFIEFTEEMLAKSPETLFLFAAFLLTEFRKKKEDDKNVRGYRECFDVDRFSNDTSATKNVSKNLCNYARRFIAAMAVKYLIASSCHFGWYDLFLPVLPFVTLDTSKRLLAPFYSTIKTFLYCCIIARGRPLIIYYKYFCNDPECKRKNGYHMKILFVTVRQGKLIYTEPSQEDIGKTAIIYEAWACSEAFIKKQEEDQENLLNSLSGRSSLLKTDCEDLKMQLIKLKGYRIEDLILADAAQHSQFAGMVGKEEDLRNSLCRELSAYSSAELSREIYMYNQYAQLNGISKKKPLLFLVEHVFAGKVSNHIK